MLNKLFSFRFSLFDMIAMAWVIFVFCNGKYITALFVALIAAMISILLSGYKK